MAGQERKFDNLAPKAVSRAPPTHDSAETALHCASPRPGPAL